MGTLLCIIWSRYRQLMLSLNFKPKTATNLDLTAPTFQPETITHVPQQNNMVSDVTNFLLKKDLLVSRLSQFCDKPNGYRVWKASFNEVIKELNVTPFKEFV